MNNKVLIVEDDPVAGMILEECFIARKIGCDVIDERDFKKILFDQLDQKYRMVVTDLFMGDYTGVEVLNWVKRGYPDMNVLAFSAEPRHSLGKFDGYIHKPIDCDEVDQAIDRFYYNA